MKITKQSTAFQPITIILETQEEASELLAVGNFSPINDLSTCLDTICNHLKEFGVPQDYIINTHIQNGMKEWAVEYKSTI